MADKLFYGEIRAFLCNGEAPCKLRDDGKPNPFCKNDVDGITGCYHTIYPEFKKNENPTKFKKVAPHVFVEVEE